MNIAIRCALAAAMLCGAPFAAAQWTPKMPIRVVVPFAPGGPTDITARHLAKKLTELLGQPVVVDNRAGANGMIGAELVAKAKPDGYTLSINSTGPMAINPGLYKQLPYDPVKDFAAVGMIVKVPIYLAVNKDVPANNFAEFVTYVKANPGKLAYGSGGNGTTAQLATEMLKGLTGMDLNHIPYKGNPAAMTDLIGGRVVAMFDSAPSVIPRLKAGQIKVLGIAALSRSANEPDIPTIAEQGVPGFEAMTWIGLFAPAGTPRPIVDRLNAALNKVVLSPALSNTLEKAGAEPAQSTPDEFAATLKKEVASWGKVIRDANIKLD